MYMTKNPLLNTDGYKPSHWMQYPPGTEALHLYISSRGGVYNQTCFFGLQAFIREYLMTPITQADIDEAASVYAQYGVPFNKEGWQLVLDRHGGLFPVRVSAVPEGTVVPIGFPLVVIESTDPDLFWVPSFLETQLLRAVWYPTTVATVSWHIKQTIKRFLHETSDDPEGQLPWKLHDFGARGVSSAESAVLGGMAHLVNFMGTDTVSAVMAAQTYYSGFRDGEKYLVQITEDTKIPLGEIAGSIPASEHSTITSWGRDNEVAAYRNMIQRYGKPGAVFAVVSDSYDIYNAVSNLWGGELRQEVIDSGAVLVVRPDSGSPVKVVSECISRLDAAFGSEVNSKGYKVLRHVRVIQGDGIDGDVIENILEELRRKGYSADNVAFGMGGALLQKIDRDTQKFAMKCSAAKINGEWVDVFKDPITDSGKTSLKGRVWTIFKDGGYEVSKLGLDPDFDAHKLNMHPVWVHTIGWLRPPVTLLQVRANSER